jgi:N-acetylglucosamine-6-phosphate deacetylase
MELRQLINGRIITPDGIIEGGSVLWSEGIIREVNTESTPAANAIVTDAEGLFVAPGCIDMHVHGGDGHDFMEATPEAFDAIRYAHALHGTTSMLATLAVSPQSVIGRCVEICDFGLSKGKGAQLLGLHLEGNYINPLYKGAQDPTYITNPDPEEYIPLLNRTECIRRWSAAPELPGATDFARYARLKGVLIALAHTAADYKAVQEGYQAGFTHATHFYNAMSGVHKEGIYKHEGTIESVLVNDGITIELIADGIHVPPVLLRLAWKVKGTARTALVTDAMSASALIGDNAYHCVFNPPTIIEDGVCKMADRSALAGSIATFDHLLRTMVQQAGVPLTEAVRMASETPARILGIEERKGSLNVGKDADIIVFDNDIHIRHTFIGGIPLTN